MKEIKGVLEAFWQTGTEGVIWSVYDESMLLPDGKRSSYKGLHCLQNGDYLKVFNDVARGDLLWEGSIQLEYERLSQTSLLYPEVKQQAVMGYWVHGLQENLDPEVWAKIFFDEKHCILIPKP